MPKKSRGRDHPINALSTPEDWTISCICRGSEHEYGGRTCRQDVRWLHFGWGIAKDDEILKIRELSYRNYIHRDTLSGIFGSDIFWSLPHLLSVRSTKKYDPEKNWNTFDEEEKQYIQALECGYPAISHLYEFHRLQNSDHKIGDWSHPISQKTFKCCLLGIDKWLSAVHRLSPIELYLTFTIKIKSNPHIRTGDLPCLNSPLSDQDKKNFRTGPAWNLSLEYLYKLIIGLEALKPFSELCDHHLHTKTFHKRIGNKLFVIINKLDEGHRQFSTPLSSDNPGHFDDLPLVLNELILDFTINRDDERKYAARINRIREALNTWDLSTDIVAPPNEASDDECDEQPEPSPSPSPSTHQSLSKLKRAWRFMRRKK